MATLAPPAARDQAFWQKMMVGIAVFIVFGFAQFAGRGMVDVGKVPAYVHFHGVIMLLWLSLAVAQATLIRADNVALHRRLGWIGVLLASAVVITGSFVGLRAVEMGRQPPFFSPPYFLALTQIGIAFFAVLVAAAVICRRETEWHRRLMLGAMVLLLEPALGRVLPMPFIMPWGEWLALVFQLGVLALVLRHDRRTFARVHPATLAAMLAVTLSHVVVETLARVPAWQALAERMIAA